MKHRKCATCAAVFTPDRMGQIACSPRCAYQSVEAKKLKAYKAETVRRKKEWRDNDKHTQAIKARDACHKYIRARDSKLPCISCGAAPSQCKRNAGHYRPSGINSALRYDERNIHGQCEKCNTHLSGNLVSYRKTLIERIGLEAVEWLDSNHEVKRWTLDELKEVHRYYMAKLKELQNG